MKKIIIIIIMSIFANAAYSIDLRKLSKEKREKKIREICKATIFKYGDSRFWVEDAIQTIEFFPNYKDLGSDQHNQDIYEIYYRTEEDLERRRDREANSHRYSYSLQKSDYYRTMVQIYADTGQAASVSYGKDSGGVGYSFKKNRKVRSRNSISVNKIKYTEPKPLIAPPKE